MRKYVVFFVLIAVLMQGCIQDNSQETLPSQSNAPPTQPTTVTTDPTVATDPTVQSTQPSETTPTEPTVSLGGVDPELFDDLTERFAEWFSWYNMALTTEYSSPAELSLARFFYNGFKGESQEPTAQEYPLLKEKLTHKDHLDYMDLIRLPVSKMDPILNEYFGIQTKDIIDFDLIYLEETDCGYLLHTGAEYAQFLEFTGAEMLEDGSIRIFYIQFNTAYAVTLKPHGDRYLIWSNLRV